MTPVWIQLPRGTERAKAGVYEANVWPIIKGWRWSVLDTYRGTFICNGQELTAEEARRAAWQAVLKARAPFGIHL